MDNRENLLKCALGLFALNGYDAVGVQAISDAAGIGKPTMYHYFGSKSGLLEALLKENLDPFMTSLEAAARYRGDIRASLHAVAGAFFDFARRKPRFYRFYLSMWFAPRESEAFKAMQAFSTRQQELIERLFSDAAEDHGNMRGRQRSYAASFLGMVNTYIMLSLNGYADLDEAFVSSLLHHYMHGIFS
jgi:AcrR family transcriptional regulator